MPDSGGGGGGGDTAASLALANISQQLFQQTDPLRAALIGRSEQFLGLPVSGGNLPPSAIGPSGQPIGQSGSLDAQIARARSGLSHKRKEFGTGRDRFVGRELDEHPDVRSAQIRLDDLLANRAFQNAFQTGGVPDDGTSPGAPGLDISASPLFLPLQQAVDRQFQRASRSTTESVPAGGQLIDALTNLETDRARSLVDIEGGLAREELNRAFGLATGTTPQAIQGLGAAGNIQAGLAQSQAEQNAASTQALGLGAGAFFGSGGFGNLGKGAATAAPAVACWVAEVLWGMNSRKTWAVRTYVLSHHGWFCRAYKRHGQRWAYWVRRSRIIRFIARIIWEVLYRRHGYV